MPLIKWQSISQCSTDRERSYLYLPQGIPAACLPPASHSCRVKLLNYVIKFNTPHLARANEVAFDRTKSFNNCKLLSQNFSTVRKASCPPPPLAFNLTCMPLGTCHTPDSVLVSPCLRLLLALVFPFRFGA